MERKFTMTSLVFSGGGRSDHSPSCRYRESVRRHWMPEMKGWMFTFHSIAPN